MTDQQACIKLAEAMGWNVLPNGLCVKGPDNNKQIRKDPPNPFTDANDDYAVLEWVREQAEDNPAMWEAFRDAISDMTSHEKGFAPYTWRYQIGDYARAALKVIDNG